MAFAAIHTVYRSADGMWINRVAGSDRASSVHRTKAEAVARGRELAINARTEHIVHNRDGSIAYRNSYGHDPYPPPG